MKNMLKAGDYVKLFDMVGTVVRHGRICQVQWLGRDFRNLKLYKASDLSPANEYDLLVYAQEIVLRTIKEIQNSTNNGAVISFCREAYGKVNKIEQTPEK